MDYLQYQQALGERVGVRELPFAAEEYAARHQAVLRRMERARVDLLVITDPACIYYLVGYHTFEVSVHTALILSPTQRILQVPSVEMGPAVAGAIADEVIGYRWENVYSAADQLVKRLQQLAGDRRPCVGMELWKGGLRAGLLDSLRERLGGWRFCDAAALVDAVRRVKSAAELEMLRESARLTRLGLDAATEAVQDGAQDSQIAAAGAYAMHAAGSEFMSIQPIVTAGDRCAIIHTTHRRHTVAAGAPVFLEFGAAWHRYTAPLMRTVIAGPASGDMRAVFATIEDIYRALIANARPGNTFDDAARAGEEALAPLVDKVFFTGVYGYTVGASFPPSWVEGSGYIARGERTEFRENMVFHLPLCLRIPGQWGIGVSETICVGADGARPITRNRWELIERA